MSHWQHRRRHLQQIHREPVEAHWLGEGTVGQECLLDTLDASLIALDDKFFRIAANIKRHNNHLGDPQAAVIVPPRDKGYWQVDYLASQFELFLVNDDYDDLQEKASWEFNFRIAHSADVTRLRGAIAVLYYARNEWHSLEDFAVAVRNCRQLLALDGQAIFALHGIGDEECTHVVWSDGQTQELSQILSGEKLILPAPSQVESVSLKILHSANIRMVPDFLKRNRKFFGVGTERAFYDRLNEPGFLPAGEVSLAHHWALLATWGAETEGKV